MANTKLFVAGLAYKDRNGKSLTDAQVGEFFAQAGTVVSAKIIKDRDTGLSRGFGFVEMSTVEEAQNAINTLNEKELEGRAILVRFSEERAQGDRPQGNRRQGNY